ncbi:MAG: alpha-E domain-containing protein [Thiomonas sp.]|nr:alpha-E domain-containing protein [Thiomonas sp.]
MLSRTADHLFWMARYTERAENTARMLDVHVQSALLPQGAEAMQLGWRGLLGISELTSAYTERFGTIDADKVLDFMVCDTGNPSSIQSCLRAARENARAVRGAITTEVWETVNQTWLESQRLLTKGLCGQDPAQFFEWVKYRSHLSRGVTSGTMLQDEAYHFLRIGTFLERADNTARLLDVKFHALQSDFYGSSGGRLQEHDFYHWSGVLRSVSGFEVYRKVYRDVITPERVAGLLILRPDMPRSLTACMTAVNNHLQAVANPQSRETLRRAGMLNAQLQFGRLDDIMATGLHAYLTHFLERINDLGVGISQDFLAA